MGKKLFSVLTVLLIISFALSACSTPAAPAPAPAAVEPAAPAAAPTEAPVAPTAAPAAPAGPAEYTPATDAPKKIAFFVSDLSNVFHQGQFTAAKKYAMEKYGAEVFAFDGKSDSATMTANVDQVLAQGMDAATLHIWDYETVKPAVQKLARRASS